jgi:hypothetical protein
VLALISSSRGVDASNSSGLASKLLKGELV